jgi:hypothetical protein
VRLWTRRRRRTFVGVGLAVRTTDGMRVQRAQAVLDPLAVKYPAAWQWNVAGNPGPGNDEWAVLFGNIVVDLFAYQVQEAP